MTETNPATTPAGTTLSPDDTPAVIARGSGPTRRLTVVEAHDVTPHMRRVSFVFDGIENFTYEPGQALLLAVPLPGDGEWGRRDYTIRSLDRNTGRLDIDFVLHGDAPGSSWARSAKPGDVLLARGPRGGTVFDAEADWHLLVGDETCIPALFHILEEMPEGTPAKVFIEVGEASDEQAVDTPATLDLVYVHRTAAKAEDDTELLDRLEAFELPAGTGHAYVIGETGKVRQMRRRLIERGLAKEQISAEGYWRPGRIGGHDHIRD